MAEFWRAGGLLCDLPGGRGGETGAQISGKWLRMCLGRGQKSLTLASHPHVPGCRAGAETWTFILTGSIVHQLCDTHFLKFLVRNIRVGDVFDSKHPERKPLFICEIVTFYRRAHLPSFLSSSALPLAPSEENKQCPNDFGKQDSF